MVISLLDILSGVAAVNQAPWNASSGQEIQTILQFPVSIALDTIFQLVSRALTMLISLDMKISRHLGDNKRCSQIFI